jgi:transcriptional regulator GlxA family with amidase domain
MGDPLPVPDLAHSVGLSTSRFARLFHDSTGTSPGRFLHQLRLARARALLESTTLSVRQVMTLVGCSDGSHFARDYRRSYGITPRQSRSRRAPRGRESCLRTPTPSRQGDSDVNPSTKRTYGEDA